MIRRILAAVLALAVMASAVPASAQRWDHGGRGHGNGYGQGNGHGNGGAWRDRGDRYEGPRRDDRGGYGRERYDRGGDGYRGQRRGWSRGQYLPPAYYAYGLDYRRYGLRRPPPGYQWVRADSDYVLMAIATGLVLDVISGAD